MFKAFPHPAMAKNLTQQLLLGIFAAAVFFGTEGYARELGRANQVESSFWQEAFPEPANDPLGQTQITHSLAGSAEAGTAAVIARSVNSRANSIEALRTQQLDAAADRLYRASDAALRVAEIESEIPRIEVELRQLMRDKAALEALNPFSRAAALAGANPGGIDVLIDTDHLGARIEAASRRIKELEARLIVLRGELANAPAVLGEFRRRFREGVSQGDLRALTLKDRAALQNLTRAGTVNNLTLIPAALLSVDAVSRFAALRQGRNPGIAPSVNISSSVAKRIGSAVGLGGSGGHNSDEAIRVAD